MKHGRHARASARREPPRMNADRSDVAGQGTRCGSLQRCFSFTKVRERDGPAKFLADYHGWVTVDAYGVNDGVYLGSGDRILASCCHAHARRKFETAKKQRSDTCFACARLLSAVVRYSKTVHGIIPPRSDWRFAKVNRCRSSVNSNLGSTSKLQNYFPRARSEEPFVTRSTSGSRYKHLPRTKIYRSTSMIPSVTCGD